MRTYLTLDCETFGLPEAVALLPEPSPPANYKDPEKIRAYVEEAQAKQLERAALYADCCRVVALAWQADPRSEDVLAFTAQNDSEEAAMLSTFWSDAWPAALVTFNGFKFDLPILIRRSQYLGVRMPDVSLDRYRSPHVDLFQRLTFNGAIEGHSLRFYCQRFGIPVDDTVQGKDIAALVVAKDWQAVSAHNVSDVRLTAKLGLALGIYPGITATRTRSLEAEVF